MKKRISYILSLYILFITVVPCSIFDNCKEGQLTEQSSNTNHRKDCGDCSSFSVCATHGFTLSSIALSVEPAVFYTSRCYNSFYFSPKSAYYSRFFQPPRLG